MIDNRTPNLNLPLPNSENNMLDDVARLRAALTAIDAAIFGKASPADITAAVNAVLAGAPAALNTLDELAAALGDDANFAASVTTALASKANLTHTHPISDITGLATALAAKLESIPMASGTVLGGIKIGSGLSIDGLGVLSATGAGVSNSFTELAITPGSNGQTVFTPSGGYTAGQIELFLNGVLLYGNGDDYTATNGTSITLTTGANTTDTLLLRKWAVLANSGAVQKTGDTMTGNINYTRVDKGTVGTGTVTFNVAQSFVQRLQVSGALTYAFSGWPTAGIEAGVKVQMVNWGSAIVTPPTVNWQLPAGGYTTNFATYLSAIGRTALQTSGTDWGVFWSVDAGATIYGKLL